MIEIDYSLLSKAHLDSLISQIVVQKAAYDGTDKRGIDEKKQQLLQQIQQGLSVIVYDAKDHFYDVISAEEFQKSCP